MYAELYLTDGVSKVSLIAGNYNGFGVALEKLVFSRPARQEGNIFLQEYDAVEDAYSLYVVGATQDTAIAQLRALDTMLLAAENFFASPAEDTLIYLVSRAAQEAKPRYAIVYGGKLGNYPNIYDQPFAQRSGGRYVLQDLDLALKRGPWLANPPQSPACAVINNAVLFQNTSTNYTQRAGTNFGAGLYRVGANDMLFAGYDPNIISSSNNGASWSTSKAFTSGCVAQRFVVAFGKLYAAVARAAGATANCGIWSATLTGGTWTQEVSSANCYSFAFLPDGTLLCGGDNLIRSKANSGGAWGTYSSVFTGAVQALLVTPVGTIIAGDTYDLWRKTVTGSFGIVPHEGVGPFTYAYAVGTRIFVVDGLGPQLSDNDGARFAYPASFSVTGLGGMVYAPKWGKLFLNNGATIMGSSDNGATWQDQLVPLSQPGGEILEGANGSLFTNDQTHVTEVPMLSTTVGPINVDCNTPVLVANKQSNPAITTVMSFDASPAGYTVYSNGNYVSSGSNIFPTTVAVGDIAYFGSIFRTFNNLYFDIVTSNKTTTLVYEFWNGSAWTTLPQLIDNTNQLRRTGLISWFQPASWVQNTVNGVNGYWVRIRVTAIGSITATPKASNVYAPTNAYVELQKPGGDIPAVVELSTTNVSDGGTGNNWTQTNALYVALRSQSRGSGFNAYLAPSPDTAGAGVNNPALFYAAHVTFTTSGPSDFVNVAQYLGPTVNFKDYYGTYRALLRCQYTGSDQAIALRLKINNFISSYSPAVKLRHLTLTQGIARVIDFGQITLGAPNALSVSEAGASAYFQVQASSPLGTTGDVVALFDLILLPVDEWVGYFEDETLANPLTNGSTLIMDSATYPKRALRALLKSKGSGSVASMWRPSASGPLMAQPGEVQRYWFLGLMWNGEAWSSPFTMTHRVSLRKHDRYMGLRGND